MAKNAAKKRRSGTRKVSKKPKNTFKFKKPDISSDVVRGLWDNNLTAEANMARLGLRQSANRDVRAPALKAAALAAPGGRVPEACEVSRLFDVPDTADLKLIDRNYGRRPMSDEDQRYTVKLMAKFGLDHEAMARDTKTNYNQITLGKLRRMCDTLLSLGDDQRVVTIPQKALKEASPVGGGDADGGGGSGGDGGSVGGASGVEAMDTGGGGPSEVVAEETAKPKKKSKRRKSKE